MEDLDPDTIKATQLSLGKFVKRPPLTEKLLKKPPFRFLHDIIITVLKTTGFFEGLFGEEELISDNVKNRESKIQFLNKVITVLSLTTEKPLTVKPSKIVAGQEPAKTNELLQCLGLALEKKLSSSEAVKKYQETLKSLATNDKKNKDPVKIIKKDNDLKKVSSKNNEKILSSEKDLNTVSKLQKKEITNKKESPPKKVHSTTNVKKNVIKSLQEKKSSTSSENPNEVKLSNVNQNNEDIKCVDINEKANDSALNDNHNKNDLPAIKNEGEHLFLPKEEEHILLQMKMNEIKKDEDEPHFLDNKNSKCILSAKTILDNIKPEESFEIKQNDYTDKQQGHDNVTIKKEPQEDEKIEEAKMVLSGNKNDEMNQCAPSILSSNSNSMNTDEKRAHSVRPSSSRPGAPRVKDKHDLTLIGPENPIVHKVNIIAENTVTEEEEESSIIIVDNHGESLTISQNEEQIQLISNEHGHLVQQILDSQKEFSHTCGKTEIEWQFGAQKARDVMNQEIEQIRFNVQALSRISNPLGKLIDHIQEDVEVMRQELQEWTRKYEHTSKELSKQKVANTESLQPLQARIKQLDADIEEKRDKINDLRIVVFKNYNRIEKLLSSGNVQ